MNEKKAADEGKKERKMRIWRFMLPLCPMLYKVS